MLALILMVASGGCGGMSGPRKSIVDEWDSVEVPSPPEVQAVSVDPATTALLVLDIQKGNCNAERRPRCVASVPRVAALLKKARESRVLVVHSTTGSGSQDDIRAEVAPLAGEPIVSSSVDKFYGTDLESILADRHIRTVILVGTSAHGAVLNTATGAALRGLSVVVPLDGMSSTEPYAEQYTAWHLANGPGTRRHVTITRTELIRF